MQLNHEWTLMNTDFQSEPVSSSRNDGANSSVILIFFGSFWISPLHPCPLGLIRGFLPHRSGLGKIAIAGATPHALADTWMKEHASFTVGIEVSSSASNPARTTNAETFKIIATRRDPRSRRIGQTDPFKTPRPFVIITLLTATPPPSTFPL
jgi:hypothetical protein